MRDSRSGTWKGTWLDQDRPRNFLAEVTDLGYFGVCGLGTPDLETVLVMLKA
jgi:hypothetical protein